MYTGAPRTPSHGRCDGGSLPGTLPAGRTPRPPTEGVAVNRRAVATACLIASPVLHLVSYFLWPAGSEGSTATQLATAAAHPGAMTAAALVEALGWVLLLPALAVLWQEVRGRGSVLVTVGVWGAVLGVLGFVSSSVLNLVTVALAGTPSGLASLAAMKESGTIALVVVLP